MCVAFRSIRSRKCGNERSLLIPRSLTAVAISLGRAQRAELRLRVVHARCDSNAISDTFIWVNIYTNIYQIYKRIYQWPFDDIHAQSKIIHKPQYEIYISDFTVKTEHLHIPFQFVCYHVYS